MFSLEELFSTENQNRALEHLKTKKDGKGSDGVMLSDLEEYWSLNKERVYCEIEEGTYVPGVVKCFEIINNIGKRRIVSNLCTLDRFIGRLLAQKMEEHIGKKFLKNSYAYQEGKGTLEAVTMAKDYMESGKRYVAVIDIKNYFDRILEVHKEGTNRYSGGIQSYSLKKSVDLERCIKWAFEGNGVCQNTLKIG